MAGKKRRKKTVRPGYLPKQGRRRGVKTAASSLPAETRTVRGLLQKRFGIICLALIALLGLLVYANSFTASFAFDDEPNIVENTAIKSFSGLTGVTSFARIVGFLTFALNYKIGGLDVTSYHVFNLAVHLTNALLVFWLVTLTLKTPFLKESRLGRSAPLCLVIALFAALIFVAHPVQTQAVTYIVQRFASLAALFYLLSLALYAKWRLSASDPKTTGLFGHRITVDVKVGRALIYTSSLVAALLAMATKEIAFTLPVVIALWEFSFCDGAVKRRLKGLLPFALTLPVIPLILTISDASPLSPAEAYPSYPTPPAVDYLLTQARVIVTYLRLLVFPVGQNLDYDYPLYRSLFDPNVLLSFMLLLALAGVGISLWLYARRNQRAPLRLAAFGIFWFFITLSVESSVIPIPDLIYEHRLYLPSVGLIMAVVAGVAMAAASLREKIALSPMAVMALGAAVVVVLAVTAFERNRVWSDPVTLWEDAAQKSLGKARPHYNLGVSYQESNQFNKAEAEFRRVIELNPDSAAANYNLGMTYVNQNRYTDAIHPFQRAIELDPGNYKAHNNLGYIYALQNRLDEALAEYRAALSINPASQKTKENIQLLEGTRR